MSQVHGDLIYLKVDNPAEAGKYIYCIVQDTPTREYVATSNKDTFEGILKHTWWDEPTWLVLSKEVSDNILKNYINHCMEEINKIVSECKEES